MSCLISKLAKEKRTNSTINQDRNLNDDKNLNTIAIDKTSVCKVNELQFASKFSSERFARNIVNILRH